MKKKYGIKLIYDEIGSTHANMCFSIVTKTHSKFWMDHKNHFKDLFESIEDYRKIILLIFLFQNDDDLLKEREFLKSDINRLNEEIKTILIEQEEEYLEYKKTQEESIIENILNK